MERNASRMFKFTTRNIYRRCYTRASLYNERVCHEVRKVMPKKLSSRKRASSAHLRKFTYGTANNFTLLRAWEWEKDGGRLCKIDQATS